MADETFLKLQGIIGESKDDDHHYEIDINYWSWGTPSSTNAPDGRHAGADRSEATITIGKFVDKASPVLRNHMGNGQRIPNGLLTVRRAGGNPPEYLKIRLMDILIHHMDFTRATGDHVEENVTLQFAKFHSEYTKPKANGAPQVVHEMGWDYKGFRKS